jgi:hypothetical protein
MGYIFKVQGGEDTKKPKENKSTTKKSKKVKSD